MPATPQQLASVTLLAMDVDGVLTDGTILLDDEGRESKRFNIKDGMGIRLWIDAGFEAAIITGRGGGAVRARCKELGIDRVIERASDKRAAMNHLMQETGRTADQCAYIGDDWNDLPAFAVAGVRFAPADAEQRVKEAADIVTARPGGHGAIRDAVMAILDAKGLSDSIATERFA